MSSKTPYLHQRPRSALSLSDDWETPPELYNMLCDKYGVHPTLDACATHETSKCDSCFTPEANALKQQWHAKEVWCNPPHSLNAQFVAKACEQWAKWDQTIMMILPSNTMSSVYWHTYIEGNAEYHAIKGRIRFKLGGVRSEHVSRNAYVVIIFRRRE